MKRIALCTLIFTMSAMLGFSQANLQPAAVVNLIRSVPINVGQLRTEVEGIERVLGRTLTQAERLEVLDGMINEQLVLQAAERDRITVTDNEVTQQVNQLRTQMAQQIGRQPSDAEFSQAIREQTGLEMRAFQEQLKRQLTMQRYIMDRTETQRNAIARPTEAEIQRTFNRERDNLRVPETVGISAIQVPFGADAAARTRARTLADSLAREIGNNAANFTRVSTRAQQANSGFQFGSQRVPNNNEARAALGQTFFDAIFRLDLDQVSGVIEGPNGFYIVRVTSKTVPQEFNMDDVLPGGTRVRDHIAEFIMAERQQAIVAQMIAGLRATRGAVTIHERNINW